MVLAGGKSCLCMYARTSRQNCEKFPKARHVAQRTATSSRVRVLITLLPSGYFSGLVLTKMTGAPVPKIFPPLYIPGSLFWLRQSNGT